MRKQEVISLSIEEFKEVIKSTIQEVLSTSKPQYSKTDNDGYYTRHQVVKKLCLSLTTLDTYTKLGLLSAYKIGHRILYRKADINESLAEKIETVKFKIK